MNVTVSMIADDVINTVLTVKIRNLESSFPDLFLFLRFPVFSSAAHRHISKAHTITAMNTRTANVVPNNVWKTRLLKSNISVDLHF